MVNGRDEIEKLNVERILNEMGKWEMMDELEIAIRASPPFLGQGPNYHEKEREKNFH